MENDYKNKKLLIASNIIANFIGGVYDRFSGTEAYRELVCHDALVWATILLKQNEEADSHHVFTEKENE